MEYHIPHRKNGTITTRVVCAVCFLAFSFLWLYMFQADVLAVAQHVLSGGLTRYDRTVGAVLITLTLQLLQLLVYAVTKLARRSHALTYLPSMLLLAVISDVNADIDQHFSLGAWLWVVPLVLVLWGGMVWLARNILPFENYDKQPTGLFSRRTWMNLLQMAAMMLAVALVGNSNAVFHYRTHAEVALLQGDTSEALRVGEESLETDAHLTMLRLFALSREGLLPERLFGYVVEGSADEMLPNATPLLLLPADTIWKHLGGRPVTRMNSQQFYDALERDSLATAAVANYRLCGLLMDRNLKDFSRFLPRYYALSDSSLVLPRYYQEALMLCQHLGVTSPADGWQPSAEVMECWQEFLQLEEAYPVREERRLHALEDFRKTYWFYYFYQ